MGTPNLSGLHPEIFWVPKLCCNLYLLPDNQIAHDFGHHRSCRVRSCLVWISLRFICPTFDCIAGYRRSPEALFAECKLWHRKSSNASLQQGMWDDTKSWKQSCISHSSNIMARMLAMIQWYISYIFIFFFNIVYIIYYNYTHIWVNYIGSHCNLIAMMVSIGKYPQMAWFQVSEISFFTQT